MRSFPYSKLLFLLFFVFTSCNFLDYIGAGTVGRIEHFDFPLSYEKLDNRLVYELQTNENLNDVDSDKYYDLLIRKNNDEDNPLNEDFKMYYGKYSYLSISINNEKLIFRYRVRNMETFSRITLVSAAKYGNGLDVARNIPLLQRNKYRNIFKEEFIDKLLP